MNYNPFAKIEWATDENYPAGGDPWSGTPTRVAPSTQSKATGFTPEAPASAEQINYVLGTAGDTAHALGACPALNFAPGVTAALAFHAKFNSFTREWMALSPSALDKFVRTSDPNVWPTVTEITGGALTGILAMWDFAIDPTTGNVIVISDQTDGQWRMTGSTGTWIKDFSNVGDDLVLASIAFDPVNGAWIIAGQASGASNIVKFFTSTDFGTTWTPRTAPAGMAALAGGPMLGVNPAGVVMATIIDGTNVLSSVSSDGGKTWSAAVTTALGFTPFYGAGGTRQPSPVWTGGTGGKFVLIVPNLSTPRTRVLSTTDGGSWTVECDLSSVGMSYAAFLSPALGVATAGRNILATQDGGATWFHVKRLTTGTVSAIAASPIQFLIAAAGTVYPGLAAGAGGLGPVT